MFKAKRRSEPRPEPCHAPNLGLALVADGEYRLCTAVRDSNGLGLCDFDPDVPGLILLGRRELNEATRGRRRQYARELKIRIHSFDWLFHNGEVLEF